MWAQKVVKYRGRGWVSCDSHFFGLLLTLSRGFMLCGHTHVCILLTIMFAMWCTSYGQKYVFKIPLSLGFVACSVLWNPLLWIMADVNYTQLLRGCFKALFGEGLVNRQTIAIVHLLYCDLLYFTNLVSSPDPTLLWGETVCWTKSNFLD